jgi:hypothetical protein
MHVSDCSIHEGGECDCGELDLTAYAPHSFVPTFIAVTGRFGFFVDHMGADCFVEPEQLPAGTLIAIAAAANLPDAHDFVAFCGISDGVDFDNTRPSIVAQLKALTIAKGVTSLALPHLSTPNSN